MAISVSTTFAGTLACFPRLATTMALACITLLIGFNAAVSETASSRAEDEPGNWLAHYSPLDQINRQTVSRLGLAWRFDIQSTRRARSQVM